MVVDIDLRRFQFKILEVNLTKGCQSFLTLNHLMARIKYKPLDTLIFHSKGVIIHNFSNAQLSNVQFLLESLDPPPFIF